MSSIYSLTYMVCTELSDVEDALCGPILFNNYDSAVDRTFKYVIGRLKDNDELCTQYIEDTNSSLTEENALSFISSLICTQDKDDICDWYFKHVSTMNEFTKGFYSIKPHHIEPDHTGNKTLADYEIQDWRISYDESLPEESTDTYRCVIKQSSSTNQVYFKMYSVSLKGLDSNLPQNGLSGILEVRNGKPGISLGLNEN